MLLALWFDSGRQRTLAGLTTNGCSLAAGSGQAHHEREWRTARRYAGRLGAEEGGSRTDATGDERATNGFRGVGTRAPRGGVVYLRNLALGYPQGVPLQDRTRLRMTGRGHHERGCVLVGLRAEEAGLRPAPTSERVRTAGDWLGGLGAAGFVVRHGPPTDSGPAHHGIARSERRIGRSEKEERRVGQRRRYYARQTGGEGRRDRTQEGMRAGRMAGDISAEWRRRHDRLGAVPGG